MFAFNEVFDELVIGIVAIVMGAILVVRGVLRLLGEVLAVVLKLTMLVISIVLFNRTLSLIIALLAVAFLPLYYTLVPWVYNNLSQTGLVLVDLSYGLANLGSLVFLQQPLLLAQHQQTVLGTILNWGLWAYPAVYTIVYAAILLPLLSQLKFENSQ